MRNTERAVDARIGLRVCACYLSNARGNFVFQGHMTFPLLFEDGFRLLFAGF